MVLLGLFFFFGAHDERSLDKRDALVFDKGCYEKNVKRQCEKILPLLKFDFYVCTGDYNVYYEFAFCAFHDNLYALSIPSITFL